MLSNFCSSIGSLRDRQKRTWRGAMGSPCWMELEVAGWPWWLEWPCGVTPSPLAAQGWFFVVHGHPWHVPDPLCTILSLSSHHPKCVIHSLCVSASSSSLPPHRHRPAPSQPFSSALSPPSPSQTGWGLPPVLLRWLLEPAPPCRGRGIMQGDRGHCRLRL